MPCGRSIYIYIYIFFIINIKKILRPLLML